ncbi:MAG: DNA-3-methyladenine glycosylase [Polyangiaceae bacterium]|nr:DNA-3-methyladenine glycosylase [Polyangiaceae bacterium]
MIGLVSTPWQRQSRLTRSDYASDAREFAQALIGAFLVVRSDHETNVRAVRIVETEAYCGPADRASHARAGLTKRTRTLLGPEGHAYVYLIYGMYDCFNIVCFERGKGHAVLVRAGEPAAGISTNLRTDGPGRLARALGITRAHDGVDLADGEEIFLLPRTSRPNLGVSARVGVAYAGAIAEAPWRFFDAESKWVSRPPKKSIGLGKPIARAR